MTPDHHAPTPTRTEHRATEVTLAGGEEAGLTNTRGVREPPAPEQTPATPADNGGTTNESRRLSRRAKQALAATGGVIAVLVSLTTLFDWFESKVVDPPAPPPKTIDARIEEADLQLQNERLVDYLRDTNQDVTGLTASEKNEKGLRFVVRVRLRGQKGTPIPLQWQLYNERIGERLRDPIYSQSPVTFTPSNQDHARTVPLWLPYPPEPGRYVVRFALLDRKRQPLDDVTVDFAVRKIPALK
jgi:hypothetical protein